MYVHPKSWAWPSSSRHHVRASDYPRSVMTAATSSRRKAQTRGTPHLAAMTRRGPNRSISCWSRPVKKPGRFCTMYHCQSLRTLAISSRENSHPSGMPCLAAIMRCEPKRSIKRWSNSYQVQERFGTTYLSMLPANGKNKAFGFSRPELCQVKTLVSHRRKENRPVVRSMSVDPPEGVIGKRIPSHRPVPCLAGPPQVILHRLG